MSIIRIKKEREYVSIANAILQNKELSWEARGVMAYLLSKPDGWECRSYDLVNQGPAGKHIIQRVMKELQTAGYIHRYQKSDGKKIEWVTEIYETPELNTTSRNTDILTTEKPTDGNSEGRESVDIVSTDSQQVLISKKTDFLENSKLKNGSAKKSQANSGTVWLGEKERTAQAERGNLNALADRIAEISKTDIDTIGPKTREALKTLTLAIYKKPNNEAKLTAYEKWWYANDWRGKQGQPPTVFHIGDTWGQFEADKVAPASTATGPVLSDVAKENYKRLLAQTK